MFYDPWIFYDSSLPMLLTDNENLRVNDDAEKMLKYNDGDFLSAVCLFLEIVKGWKESSEN